MEFFTSPYYKNLKNFIKEHVEIILVTRGGHKIELIKRKTSEQWYVNFPTQIAQAMNFKKGKEFEWIIQDSQIILRRLKNE